MKQSNLRAYVLGFLVPFAAALILAASAVYGPNKEAWGHITRVLDSFAVHLLALAFLCAFLVILLRAFWVGSTLLMLTVVASIPLVQIQIAQTQPLATDQQPNLRLLWFNALADNQTPAQKIIDLALATEADIIVFAESAQFQEKRSILEVEYPYQLGCTELCELLVFSKTPLSDSLILPMGPLYGERIASFKVTPQDTPTFSLVAAHMSKPWYMGLTEREDHRLDVRLRKQSGPLVLVGDFNAAPWSHRIRLRLEKSGLKGIRIPVSTWPVSFGRFGIPIDQVFVGGGVEVVSIEQWGQDLGSNHLGLLVGLYVPPASAQ